MRLQQITTTARPLDLSRPSNRLAVLATGVFLVVGIAVGLTVGDAGLTETMVTGARVAVGAFLAWAIGREIDPDRVATPRHAVFAYVLLVWLGPPSVTALIALLVALRVLLRPTGLPPTGVDLAVAVAVAGVTAWFSVLGTPMGLAVAFALALDYRLPGRDPHRLQWAAAGVTVLVVVLAAWTAGTFLQGWRALTGWEIGALAAGLLGTTQLEVRRIDTTTDLTGEPLSRHRLVRTRQTLAVAVIVGVLWSGGAGVPGVAPALAALVGLGATSLLPHLRP